MRTVELGTEAEALSEVGSERFDQATYKALGSRYEVGAIFLGELVVSDVRPPIRIARTASWPRLWSSR